MIVWRSGKRKLWRSEIGKRIAETGKNENELEQ